MQLVSTDNTSNFFSQVQASSKLPFFPVKVLSVDSLSVLSVNPASGLQYCNKRICTSDHTSWKTFPGHLRGSDFASNQRWPPKIQHCSQNA